MLVIVMENQLLSPSAVCKDCPMASQSGLPRWQKGRLRCARPASCTTGKPVTDSTLSAETYSSADRRVGESAHSASPEDFSAPKACTQYECAMGFRVAKLSEQSA